MTIWFKAVMVNSVAAISFIFLTLAVRGNAQTVQCYLQFRNCGGFAFTLTLDQCRNLFSSLSYRDTVTGECVNFPIIFGFEQTSLVGVERRDEYSVNMGFLEGALDTDFTVEMRIILESARNSDINLITPTRTFQARSSTTQLVTFILVQDSIAEEFNETFKLWLDFDRSFFAPNDTVTFSDHLLVTILNREVANMGFSEDDYVTFEGADTAAPVRIVKDRDTRLANPVVFRVTPLTVDDALAQGVIAHFPAEDYLTLTKIQRSPLRANEDRPITVVNAPIPIVNDNINEAEKQEFIAKLDVNDAVNSDTLKLSRKVATCIIYDDDVIRIGFSRQVYTYFEPPFFFPIYITNVTLVKDDNQVSEQTFRVGIVASNAPGIVPATLQTADSTTWDYRISVVSQTYFQRDFPPNVQEMSMTFFLNGDEFPEALEGFMLTTSVVSKGFPPFLPPRDDSTTAFQSTRIEIIDNDFARVGWEQLNYTINETDVIGQACVIVFNPPTDIELPFNIHLEYQSTTGTADASDFFNFGTYTPIALTIPASISSTDSRRTCVYYYVFQDFIGEDLESFTLTLNSAQQLVIIDAPVTDIFITDSDAIVIGFINAPYIAKESNGMATLLVGLSITSAQLQRTVSVLVVFTDGTAQSGSDYNSASQLITFSPGNTAISVSVPLVDDGTFELTEIFQARLEFPGAPPERVTIDPGEANVTIFDNDLLVFGFVDDTYEVLEDAGPATPSVQLLIGDLGEFTVTLTVATDDFFVYATAQAGLDYISLPGFNLSYFGSTHMLSFDVDIIDDNLTELQEFFKVFINESLLVVNEGVAQSLTSQESARISFLKTHAWVFITDT